MASTVIKAFDEFIENKVNLDADETKVARRSRDWLMKQIHEFPNMKSDFPKLFEEKNLFFGSFSRKTKIRELDDIDIMIGLSAEGSFYTEHEEHIEITVSDDANILKSLCYDGTNSLNSKKVINKFISSLKEVPQYEKAEMKRNHEAANLKLNSYNWNFDLVPCFFTKENSLGRTYYLIPDGQGHWKKTDPRIDQERVSSINQDNSGNVLNVIRALKYWNKNANMPTVPSYLFENIVLNFYKNNTFSVASNYVDIEITNLLSNLHTSITSPINDPSGIQGDINTLDYDTRLKVSNKALDDYHKAKEAREYEENENHEKAINKWREIFGTGFPKYELV